MVPLEAVTVKVTEAKFGTLWLKGWTVITAGGPEARQRPAARKTKKRKQTAVFFNRSLWGSLFVNTLGDQKLLPCHALESVGQLDAEGPPILLESILHMEPGGGVVIFAIQHIVNAG